MGKDKCNGKASVCCESEEEEEEHVGIPALLFSFILLVGGLVLNYLQCAWFVEHEWMRLAWYLIAYVPVAWSVWKQAYTSILKHNFFSEFTLMTVTTVGAFCIKEYPEGVAVMLFYSIGELFQDRAVDRAKNNIKELLDVRPDETEVLRDDVFVTVKPEDVKIGETIQVKAGGRVPLDGMLLTDYTTFNTSALTGESLPRRIHRGQKVLAGMVATDKVTELRVSNSYNDSTLARILKLVQEASERKAPAELFIRKFAGVYTPVVFVLAVLIIVIPCLYSLIATGNFNYVFQDWLYRGLVFLVVSCPCALVVSIPLGYFGGIGAASKLGVLFKGGNYLDAITKIDTFVFDKTGTLTKGLFGVESCCPVGGMDEKTLIGLIASVEKASTHPIAKTIVAYAKDNGITLSTMFSIEELTGYGLKAHREEEETLLVGNTRLLQRYHIAYPAELDRGEVCGTVVVAAKDGKYIGYLLLSDTLKDDAVVTVQGLRRLHKNVQMMSGDRQSIVTAFARKLGVDNAYGDLLPQGKVEHIERLKEQGHKVAFIGDGMNDAPVLALSDVSVAMGGLGSDAAIETSDIVIQTDQPSKIVTAIKVGRRTRNVVMENIVFAMGVKVLVLLLGALGIANLWEAVFADVGVAFIAVLNAVRIQHLIKE